MGIKIPEHKRSAIIDAWLRGETRDNIALEIEVAGGTVSNVIEEWQNNIGAYDANNLRKLGLALKKGKNIFYSMC